MPITFTNVIGEESATATFRIATVQVARGTTNEQVQLSVVADPSDSLGLSRVLAAAPVSTEYGQIVRIAGGPSSLVDLAVRAVLPSTATDNPVNLAAIAAGYVSTATPAGGSSGLNVWTVGGILSSIGGAINSVSSLSTGHVTVDTGSISVAFCSSLSTGHVTVDTGSISVSAFAAGYVSSATPAAGSSGLNVWNVGGILSSVGGAINQVSSLSTGHVTVDTGSISVAFCSSLSTGHVTIDTGSISVAFCSSLSTGHVTVDTGSISVSAFAAGYVSSATPAGGSSGLNVWNVGGILSSVGGAINSVSSLSTGHVTVDTGSIALGGNLQSTSNPSSGSSGLTVRQALSNVLTYASSNAFASTLVAINTTAAGQQCRVFAYSITSTVQTPTKISFYDGTTLAWVAILASISSAVTGANMAVSPPWCLFQGTAASSMTMRTPSSIAGFKVSVSYIMAQ